jgi:hypothetical protein
MSDNLDDFFTRLREVAQLPALAEPADIRRRAGHRTHVRHGVVAGALTILLSASGFAAYNSGVFRPSPNGPGPGPGVSSADASAPPGPTGGNPTSPPSPTPPSSSANPVRLPGADCRPADLDPRPYYADGAAMGTAYMSIIVQNISATRCQLYGHPTVLFTDPSTGRTATMPTQRDGGASPVMLQPGQWATAAIERTNGNPYGPGAPECAQPRSYRGLSLLVGNDLPYRLPGLTMAWECGDARIQPWTPADGPTTNGTPATRSP